MAEIYLQLSTPLSEPLHQDSLSLPHPFLAPLIDTNRKLEAGHIRQLHQRNYIIVAYNEFINGKVSRHRPALYLHSFQPAKISSCFILFLSLSSARFCQESSLSMRCVDSSRSSWYGRLLGVCHQGISLCAKPDRLVCLQRCLVAALPCLSTCCVPFRCFHGDWSTGVKASCYITPPSTKLCPIDPNIPVTLPQ